ncbi:DDE endonuclease, partial [Agarivorans sp. B2Z047]
DYCARTLWQKWEQAGEKAQHKAEHDLRVVRCWHVLKRAGLKKGQATDAVSQKYSLSTKTISRLLTKIAPFEEKDWLAALVNTKAIANRRKAISNRARIPDEAWEIYKADYLRSEQPSHAACYYRLEALAPQKGWELPSKKCFRQRLLATVSEEMRILKREGEHALFLRYGSQTRTVEALSAMSALNGDGYKHNVFVRFPSGETRRPVTWFWQDIRTRKIVGWRTDISENMDSIRLSLRDVIDRYGIPKKISIDNTRAAANKDLTGGARNRYRFKVKEDDPEGLIVALGIEIHWTTVNLGKGHGQAKPIERAFGVGGMDEFIDKHPALAGAYTGPNPTAKPDNYGERVIPLDEFLKVVEQGVHLFNSRANRETEMCQGRMSFNEAFERDYANAVVRMATPEQKRMFLLSAETAKVSKFGKIQLKAGGKIQERTNQYCHDALFHYIGKKLIIRFDPQNLHGSVHCYTLQNTYICEAECVEPSSFYDRDAAREQKRLTTRKMKNAKELAAAQTRLNELDVAAQMSQLKIEDEELPPPAASALVHVKQGNTVAQVSAESLEDEQHYEAAFAKRVSLLMAEKRRNEI